jgi:hypothetical protein
MSFDDARRAALMSDLIRPLLGRPTDLVPFDEVEERLPLESLVDRGVREVPLASIVGSVNRSRDFSRAFLPRDEALRERWDDVRALALGPRGFPPVELYQVGELYFVLDGHHRVSVARDLGLATIEAHILEFLTPVAVRTEAELAQLLTERGLGEFLATTGLRQEESDDYRTTEPDGYQRLLDHIAVHRYFRGLEEQRCFGWDEAVASWHDSVYQPVVATIRASAILDEFPDRTATDLYLWVMDHLYRLRQICGEDISFETVVDDFAARLREDERDRWHHRLRRWLRRLRGESASPSPADDPASASVSERSRPTTLSPATSSASSAPPPEPARNHHEPPAPGEDPPDARQP